MSDVETPEGLLLPVGTLVTVTGDTANWEHELWIESSAIVVGYSDNALGGDMGYTLIAAKPEEWHVHPDDVQKVLEPPRVSSVTAPTDASFGTLTSGRIRTDGSAIIEPAQRTEALEWALERFPEDDVANLVKLATWILTGDYR